MVTLPQKELPDECKAHSLQIKALTRQIEDLQRKVHSPFSEIPMQIYRPI